MTADTFIDHVARVRARFAANLPGKITDSFADLEKLSGGGAGTIESMILVRRRLHEIYGIAPTLGFVATGKAARSAETAIREAAEAKRAATPAEIAALKSELERLRTTATDELQDFREGVAQS